MEINGSIKPGAFLVAVNAWPATTNLPEGCLGFNPLSLILRRSVME